MGGDHFALGLGQFRRAGHDGLDELKKRGVKAGIAQKDVGDALEVFRVAEM